MGEARRRGNFATRKSQAIARREAAKREIPAALISVPDESQRRAHRILAIGAGIAAMSGAFPQAEVRYVGTDEEESE